MTELEPRAPSPFEQFFTRLIPHAGPALAQLRSDLYERQQERMADMVNAAIESADLDARSLFERVAEEEELTDLLNLCLDAALRTRVADKRRAIGRALGQAIVDDALIEDHDLLIKTLDEIEMPHIRVLRYVAERTPAREDTAFGGGSIRWPEDVRGVETHNIVHDVLQGNTRLAEPILGTLERLHLIERAANQDMRPNPPRGGAWGTWFSTGWADSILEQLEHAALPPGNPLS